MTIPTEELFGQPSEEEKEEAAVNQLLNFLPESFEVPIKKKHVEAFARIFMGDEAFDSEAFGAQQTILRGFEEKLAKLVLLITSMTSGLPLSEDFPNVSAGVLDTLTGVNDINSAMSDNMPGSNTRRSNSSLYDDIV